MAVVVRRGLGRGRRRGVGRGRGADRAPLRRRRAHRAQHRRAGERRPPTAPITAENVEDAARKPPLVYDKAGDAHYDFTSAFIKSMRGSDRRRRRLLPRRDARGRRGRALHRAADDRARLRGHRQRRPARAPRRGRGGAGGRARRPARGAPQPLPGGDLPRPRAEVERELHGAEPGGARTCGSAAPRGRRRRCATAPGTAAGSGTARATSTRTTIRTGFETSYLPEELEGRRYYEPSGSGEESADENAS